MAVVVVIGVPAITVGYALLAERALQFLPERRRPGIRPWLWLAPGLLFLIVYLIWPTVQTIVFSFMDRRSEEFVGLENYTFLFSTSDMWNSVLNNVFWIVIFAGVTV